MKVFLPFNPVWILIAIGLLVAANYVLLYRKIYMIIDTAIILFVPLLYSLHIKSLLEVFMTLLIFASIRLLSRREFSFLPGGYIAPARKRVLLASAILVLFLWGCILVMPRIFSYGEDSIREGLVTIARGLGLYASDHGTYPVTLSEAMPRYVADIPRPYESRYDVMRYTDREVSFYARKFNLRLDYSYEVNSEATVYTLCCHLPRNVSDTLMKYDSAQGFIR